jgi:hypothetical protein
MVFLYREVRLGESFIYDILTGGGSADGLDPMNFFVSSAPTGKWNTVCMVCGIRITAATSKKRWDGLWVCHSDWEPRHSLDFFKARDPRLSLAPISPEPLDVFVAATSDLTSGQADIGAADMAQADRITTII